MATQDSITLDITGMTCASCVRRVERALSKVPGVETASVNFAAETARVTLAAEIEPDQLIEAVQKAGYQAAPAGERREDARERHARRTLWQLLVFGALAAPTIVLAMAMDIAGMHINDDPKLHG